MKRNYISLLSTGLSAAILIASCAKTAGFPETENNGTETSFSASFETPTKIAYTEDDSAVRITWKEADKIGIWAANTAGTINSNCTYKADAAAAQSAFSYVSRAARIHWASETEPQSFYALYPYSETSGADPHEALVSLPSVQAQESAGDISHLAKYDIMWAAAENKTKEDGDVSFTFHHAFSVVELDLQTDTRMKLDALIFRCTSNPSAAVSFEGGKIDLATGEIDLSGATTSSEVRLDCNFATSWPASSKMYMVVNSALAGETVEIVAVIAGQEKILVTREVPGSGLPKGKVACVKVDYAVPDDVAVKIIDLGAVSTSNCYLVTEASQYYKFKATVKGNGNIPSELSGIETSPSVTPKSVIVLWYNTVQTADEWVDKCPIVLSSLVFFRDYIFFDTPKEFVPGNVVIAAFAEEGVTYESITADANKTIDNATLLWSWNIWAAEGYEPEATAIESGGKLFMDRYVGAALAGLDKTGAYEPAGAVGNYYQWGRKDPIPPYSDYTHIWPTKYGNTLFCTPTYTPVKALQIDAQSSAGTLNGQMFGYRKDESGTVLKDNAWNLVTKSEISSVNPADNKEYVGYAVAHPYKLIVGEKLREAYDYTWLNTYNAEYKSLWGQSKTLYDPCPAGWRICTKDEAESLLKTIEGTAVAPNNCGGEWNGHYFPINNYRNFNTFHIEDPVQSNYYNSYSLSWTCSFYDFYNWSYFHTVSMQFPSNYALDSVTDKSLKLSISNNVNARALNVRCVKE